MKSRRSFFTQTAALAAAGLAPLRLAPQAGRRQQAYRLKVDAAVYQRDHAWANNLTNGDEQAYPNHIASFTKTLPHNQLGEVDSKAYAQLTRALDSGLDDDFAAIPLGGTVKLQDPQAHSASISLGRIPINSHCRRRRLLPAPRSPERSRNSTGRRSHAMCRLPNTGPTVWSAKLSMT